MRDEDAALVERSRHGDLSAYDALVRRHQPRVLRTLYLLLPNQNDVEDVAQEVFIRAFRHLSSFRGDCEFSTWLHRIAINTLRSWAARRKQMPSLDALPEEKRPHPEMPSAEEHLLSREAVAVIRKALAALPEHYREALVLRYFHNMTYEQIADALQVPLGTVRSRLAKGREILVERLAGAGVIDPSERILAR